MKTKALFLVCVVTTVPMSVRAQNQAAYSVAAGLRQFAETGDSELPVAALPAAGWVASVTIDPAGHAPAVVDSVLSGLESIALTSDNPRVRARAVRWLRQAGDAMHSSPVSGIVDRLRFVYERSTDRSLRAVITQWMPQQAERDGAADFLEEVATDDSPVDAHSDWPLAYLAVDGLTRMGSRGEAALRRLYENGSVRNGRARERLGALARGGFHSGGLDRG